MLKKLKCSLIALLGCCALYSTASADGSVLDYNEALKALSAPVVQASATEICPYVITYSDGTTDCLRQAVADDNVLFAKPREVNAKVEFENASAKLTPLGRRNLDTIIAVVNTPSANLRTARFSVAGHTNALGNSAYNKWLSEQRAASVTEYLKRSGAISADRIVAVGYGEDRLLPNVHPNAPQNRRVMIEVVR